MILDELGITQEECDGPIEPPLVDGRYVLDGVYELTSAQCAKVQRMNNYEENHDAWCVRGEHSWLHKEENHYS